MSLSFSFIQSSFMGCFMNMFRLPTLNLLYQRIVFNIFDEVTSALNAQKTLDLHQYQTQNKDLVKLMKSITRLCKKDFKNI